MNDNWNSLLADHSLQTFRAGSGQPDLFLCPLTDHGITSLKGEQSRDYLQGQLTNDMALLCETNYLKAAHCDAKGKAWAIIDAFTVGEYTLLSGHTQELAASTAQLQKYGVFAKTTIEDASSTWFTFGLGGPDAAKWLLSNWDITFNDDVKALDVPDGKVLKLCSNSFLWVTSQPQALLQTFSEKLYQHDLWDYWNIVAGIAYLNEATTGQHVPQTLNLHCLDAISFDKGCYSGQEMVARMKYLGKNKRATYVLHGKASKLPEDAHELQLSLGDNWRRSGTVLNIAGTPDNLYLLAILPNDLTQDARFRLKDDEESALTIQPLPYAINAE